MRSDPIGLDGGLNTYGYAMSSPLNWIDPYGLDICYPKYDFILFEVHECRKIPTSPTINNEGWTGWEPDGGISHPDKIDQKAALNCPNEENECVNLSWSIDVIVRQMKFYRWDAQRNQRMGKTGGYSGHKKLYIKTLQAKLIKLVARAKQVPCPYNPEADKEINRSFDFPTRYY